jgi:galactokinase
MTANAVINALGSAGVKKLFAELYGSDETVFAEQKKRYTDLIEAFRRRFGEMEISLWSSPGRSEICGNHTDHNHGKVLAASVQLDTIAVVSPNFSNKFQIFDSAYNEDYTIDVNDTRRIDGEKGSPALVRGIAEGFKNAGFRAGGFCACFSSRIIPASGVSSSAAFEMLICQILNGFYNSGAIPVEKLAKIGQYAENVYWKKASGLLDQIACGFGGLIAIDFETPDAPLIEKIPFDFAAQSQSVALVNTGGNHAELSGEYSAIPAEMKQVARYFKRETLREISAENLVKNLPSLRLKCGDRALMRAFHFIEENIRVEEEIAALRANDFPAFLSLVSVSGNSSWKWLQNVYVPSDCIQNQSVSVSLALTEMFIRHHALQGKAACRIHGGGFAGAIQVFLPNEVIDEYTRWMIGALRPLSNPVTLISVRPCGVKKIMPRDEPALC